MPRKVTELTDTLTIFKKLKRIAKADDGVKLLEEYCELWRKNYAAKRQRTRLKEPEAKAKQNARSKSWYANNKDDFNKKRSKKERNNA